MTFDPMFSQQVRMQAESRAEASKDYTPAPVTDAEDHELHAPGQECARCHRVIGDSDDVRRNGKGEWVHDDC